MGPPSRLDISCNISLAHAEEERKQACLLPLSLHQTATAYWIAICDC